MLATVNPCGFALLPAYLSTFVGMEDRSRSGALMRAVAVAGVMTLGFVSVFGVFGLVIKPLFSGVSAVLPYMTVVIGFALVVLALYLLSGRDIQVALPKLSIGGRDGSLVSMYLFGVSYAVASLSCTIGPFLAVTTSTLRQQSFVAGVATFVLYGVGMGVIVTVLTVAVALAKSQIVTHFRQLLPVVNRVAGVFLLVAGAYVAYYGWYEVRLFNGNVGNDPVIAAAAKVQHVVVGLFPGADTAPYWALGLVLLTGGVVVFNRLRRPADTHVPSGDAD